MQTRAPIARRPALTAALTPPPRLGPPLPRVPCWPVGGLAPSLLLCGVMALGGCAGLAPQRSGAPPAQTPAQTPAPTPAPSGASARTQAAEVLAIEQQWLQDWFRGTPVRIALRSDGILTIDVPREFCFEAGRSRILPALSAVLDKVAQSLNRRPTTRLTGLAGPADPAGVGGPAALGLQRATAMQRHLRDRGIALARLAEPLAEGSTGVQLRIGMSAP